MQITKNYISATLPIDSKNGLYLNSSIAREFGEKLSSDYCFAEPYPHIVIDNFLPLPIINEIYNRFPLNNLTGDKFFENGYEGLHKRQIYPENCDEYVRNFFRFMNSAPILQFLESLTTINTLIGDPYFNGGGFHETFSGGKLGIHADFRINRQLNLNRRINMIVYLNNSWENHYGGALEIWDRNMLKKHESILPIFNRCVIFNTEQDTYHGHPDPLCTPLNISRKSIALYYYSASTLIYDEVPAHSTMYKSRLNDNFETKRQVIKLQLANYLRDFFPPIAIRNFKKIKKYFKK